MRRERNPSFLKVQRKVRSPVSLGELLTTLPSLTSTESRPVGGKTSENETRGENRWRAGELWQIGGEGVMSRKGGGRDDRVRGRWRGRLR